jgi:hypothetical protein
MFKGRKVFFQDIDINNFFCIFLQEERSLA